MMTPRFSFDGICDILEAYIESAERIAVTSGMIFKNPEARKTVPFLLFLLETLSAALFLDPRFPGGKGPSVLRIAILWVITALIFERILSKTSGILSKKSDGKPGPWIRSLIISFSPLLLLNVELLENIVFLRDLRPFPALLAVGGTIFLTIRLALEAAKNNDAPTLLALPSIAPKDTHPRRTSWIIFGSAYAIYICLLTGLAAPRQPFTGDEPHYLLITHSLVADGDINLFNNYRDRDNRKFYPGDLDPHAPFGKRGGSFRYSRHAPGLACLLIPHYALGNILHDAWISRTGDAEGARNVFVFTVRSFMAFLTALLGLAFFRLVEDLISNRRIAWAAWAVFSFTSPILFYSGLIYPEIPAAIILLFVFKSVIISKNPSFTAVLYSGTGIAFLPWLGVKYAVPAAAAAALCLFALYSRRRGMFLKLGGLLIPSLLSGGGFLFFLWNLYGNFRPSSLYTGADPAAGASIFPFFHMNFWEFLRCGSGYLIDQRAGIFPYSLFYLLFIPGLILLGRRSRGTTFKLLGLLLPVWIFFSMGYYWGGYCPPARTLLPVVWIPAVFAAATLSEPQRPAGRFLSRLTILAAFAASLILIRNPTWLYHEHLSFYTSNEGKTSHLLREISTPLFDFTSWVPSFSSPGPIRWLPPVLALVLTAGLTWLLVSGGSRKETKDNPHRMRGPLVSVFLISCLILSYVAFDINAKDGIFFENRDYTLYFQSGHHYGREGNGFWTRGDRRTDILLSVPGRISCLTVDGTSPISGATVLRVGPKRHVIPRPARSTAFSESFESPVGFPWKGGFLYALSIHETSSYIPAQSDPNSSDRRELGLFVTLDVRLESGTSQKSINPNSRNPR